MDLMFFLCVDVFFEDVEVLGGGFEGEFGFDLYCLFIVEYVVLECFMFDEVVVFG